MGMQSPVYPSIHASMHLILFIIRASQSNRKLPFFLKNNPPAHPTNHPSSQPSNRSSPHAMKTKRRKNLQSKNHTKITAIPNSEWALPRAPQEFHYTLHHFDKRQEMNFQPRLSQVTNV